MPNDDKETEFKVFYYQFLTIDEQKINIFAAKMKWDARHHHHTKRPRPPHRRSG